MVKASAKKILFVTVIASLVGLPLLAQAQEKTQGKTYVMKVTTPTINDGPHLLAKNFAAAVALNFTYYNFCKSHLAIRMTPAQAAGIESSQ